MLYVDWHQAATPITVSNFTSEYGPTVPITNDPLSLFSLYYSEEIVDEIVEQTNKYAEQVLAAKGSDKEWSTNLMLMS